MRQRTTNRVSGRRSPSSPARGLSPRTNSARLHQRGEGCHNDPWTHGPCANPRQQPESGRAAAGVQAELYDFSYTLDNLVQLDRNIGTKHVQATALYSIQHDNSNRDSLYASNCRTTTLWYDPLRHGRASSSAASSGAALVHGSRQLHAARPVHDLRGPRRRLSRLAPGHKWAYSCPSDPRGAWRRGIHAVLRAEQLKVRASYGTTGNNTSINPYATRCGRPASTIRHQRARYRPARFRIPPGLGEDRPDRRRHRARLSATGSPAR